MDGYDGNYTMTIYRAPQTDVLVSYVSRNWMATEGGVAGRDFTAESDVLLMPAGLVEAGTVLRSRRCRGLQYQDIIMEYEAKLSRFASSAGGGQSLSFGEQSARRPWDHPEPYTLGDF